MQPESFALAPPTPLARLAALYLAAFEASARWREQGVAEAQRVLAEGPAIICLWHGRTLLARRALRLAPRAAALVSHSRDGERAAGAAGALGVETIRASRAKGAKRKGGIEALPELAAALSRGASIAFTPDGPRGPAERAGPAAAQLARFTGAPLLPVGLAATPCWRAGSWDRLIAPAPFAKGAVVWADPIRVDRRAGAEAVREAQAALEAALARVTAEAEALLR